MQGHTSNHDHPTTYVGPKTEPILAQQQTRLANPPPPPTLGISHPLCSSLCCMCDHLLETPLMMILHWLTVQRVVICNNLKMMVGSFKSPMNYSCYVAGQFFHLQCMQSIEPSIPGNPFTLFISKSLWVSWALDVLKYRGPTLSCFLELASIIMLLFCHWLAQSRASCLEI